MCDSEPLCFKHKIKTIQVAPSATPTRQRQFQKGVKPAPSWEKGIPTDSRGMPFLKADGSYVTQKEYAENRTKIDEKRRELRNAPAKEN